LSPTKAKRKNAFESAINKAKGDTGNGELIKWQRGTQPQNK